MGSTRYYKYRRYQANPSVIDFYKRGEDPEAPPIPEGARRVTGGTAPYPKPDINDLIRRITGGGVDVEPEERNGNGNGTDVSLEGDMIEDTGADAGAGLGLDSNALVLLGLGAAALLLFMMLSKRK